MRILLTGTPGTGKSRAAQWLSRRLKCPLIKEKQFALEHQLGSFEDDEFVIPLKKLQAALNKRLKGKKNVVLEGHLLCEIRLKVDLCLVLTVHPELLEARLRQRGYGEEKIQDNVFCEGIDYCKKHALRNYKNKVVEIRNEKTFKDLQNNILKALKGKG